MPIGFINELHEPPIFLGALRPQLEQEGGLIPPPGMKTGVGSYDELPGDFTYELYVVNGLRAEGFDADERAASGTGDRLEWKIGKSGTIHGTIHPTTSEDTQR